MHYDDLTSYCYNENWIAENAVNVGWLGNYVPSCHLPEKAFLEKLGNLCCEPIHLMRGFHCCEICGANPMSYTDPFFQKYHRHLGNGEIWLRYCGAIYVAPTLIYHYVNNHMYSPPEQSIKAVLCT